MDVDQAWHTGSVPEAAHSGVGESPNRRLQSATRPLPAAGWPGEIPGPTV